ncbi:MAG: phosphotransferase [Polyangiaceae bacterium]|nr:phosphotransferase [Polyangiaceae bacterium]
MTTSFPEVERHGFVVEEILNHNPRKRQYTALVTDGARRRYVAKWRTLAEAGSDDDLAREVEAYQDLARAPFVAQPVLCRPRLLVVEHVPSSNLRQFLLATMAHDPARTTRVLDHFFALFDEAYGYERFYFSRDTYLALFVLLKRLALSGPRGTPRTQRRLANAACMLAPIRRLRSEIPRLTFDVAAPVRIHGDLHLDNILVPTESNDLKIIDWENSHFASPLLDFLYSTAMVGRLLSPHSALHRRFETLLEQALSAMPTRAGDLARYFHGLFESVIATNSRFGPEVTATGWLRLWIRVYEQVLLLPTEG